MTLMMARLGMKHINLSDAFGIPITYAIAKAFLFFTCLFSLSHCNPGASLPLSENTKTKNIILLIGDGMGPQQIGLLEAYARRAPDSIYQGRPTAISRLANKGSLGLALTAPHDKLVNDSACAATQLASGQASRNEMIGLDIHGQRIESILEYAKSLGKSTGLVSDTRLTHATPAAFAAHQAHRSMENEIAAQLIQENQVDVMLSGGLTYFLPRNAQQELEKDSLLQQLKQTGFSLKSKRQDDKHLLAQARQQGFELLFDNKALQQASGDRLLGLFAHSAMQDASRYTWQKNTQEPSLKDMSIKALETLSKNENGFFLMIEAGQIDWAGHNNDAGRLLHEMIRFDEALKAVYQWASNRDDTLLLVTADHETGGFGFSYSAYNMPEPMTLPGEAFNNKAYAPNFNFGELAILDQLYQQQLSFVDIWKQALQGNDFPKALDLMNAINENTAFTISLQEAQNILARETNPFPVENHKYLKAKEVPKVHDFKAFYVYGDEVHLNLMGRALSKYQNVVWNTGTHTHTPVPVIARGPGQENFKGIQTQTQVGQSMRELLH